jgi:hypothetical protein
MVRFRSRTLKPVSNDVPKQDSRFDPLIRILHDVFRWHPGPCLPEEHDGGSSKFEK